MEALIPAPAYCEVRSVIKFFLITERRADLNSSSTVPGLWPHTARRSTHLLQEFSWDVFIHPPYIPDLAPSIFHIFLYLKKFPSGQRQNDREAEMSVTQWLQPQAADFCNTGIQKLVSRYDKCLNSGGEYVEK